MSQKSWTYTTDIFDYSTKTSRMHGSAYIVDNRDLYQAERLPDPEDGFYCLTDDAACAFLSHLDDGVEVVAAFVAVEEIHEYIRQSTDIGEEVSFVKVSLSYVATLGQPYAVVWYVGRDSVLYDWHPNLDAEDADGPI